MTTPVSATPNDPIATPPATLAPGRRWATEDVDQPWNVGEAIGVAMRAMRGHPISIFLPVLGAALATYILAAIPLAFVAMTQWREISGVLIGARPPPALGPMLLGTALATIVLGFVGGSFTLALLFDAGLAAVRDVPKRPGSFGRALRATPRLAGFQLLVLAVAVLPNAILLGVPYGIARATGAEPPEGAWQFIAVIPLLVAFSLLLSFSFTPFFIVDDDAKLIAAMSKSWRATKQYLGTIFLYSLAFAPLAILAVIPLFGVLPMAFVWLGLAYAYARSTGRNDLAWLRPEFASKSIRRFLRLTLTALTAIFAWLHFWIRQLPELRGSAWSIKDTLIRAAAILTGVALIVVALALLLPYLLDRLEGRRFTSFVAARHVRSQKSGFLTIISVLSICGVAISSCALSSVVSVMGGFSQDLKRKILGNNAHIVIDTTAGVAFGDYDPTLARVRAIPGVIGATAVVHGEVMASSASNLAGVIVNGVDPVSVRAVIELVNNIEVGKLDYLEHPEELTRLPPDVIIGVGPGGEQYYRDYHGGGGDLPGLPDDTPPGVRAAIAARPVLPGIILGRELAKTLHLYVADEVTLVSPLGDLGPMGVMPRTKKFRVAGIFYSGMYEYDASYVYTLTGPAQEYFGTQGKVTAIEVKVDDAERADVFTPLVTNAIARPDLRVRDWREINKNLFSALKLERFATFIILSIAIMVASFCIVCTLLLMVTEKGKEIAILKAIGASDGMILRTFMLEGIIIGGIGTVFGVVTGLSLCTGLAWFGLRLDPEVYYIDRLPISVNGWDFLTVALAAMTICTLSTLYPAFSASRLRPVDGLRYE